MLSNRYEFVLLFDVKDGNPNGDPDAGNLPRTDPDTDEGLVTDVCLKRKIRNHVLITRGSEKGFDIFVKERSVLESHIIEAAESAGISLKPAAEEAEATEEAPEADAAADPKAKKKASKEPPPKKKLTQDDAAKVRAAVCQRYFDVRAFGAVLTTIDSQVRGPVQLTFARSIDPVTHQEHSITRMAVASLRESKEKGGNQTMGRKTTIGYALYRAHGFVSPAFAGRTGFSEADLDQLWRALAELFEHDRSAARGLMAVRRLIVFKHDTPLGCAPAHKLFELVQVRRKSEGAARSFEDYEVSVGTAPKGVSTLYLVS